MDNKKFIWAGVTLVLLTTLFVAVSSVMANPPPPPPTGTCGASPVTNVNGLVVKKNVDCTMDRSWEWTINKSADASSLTLSLGQSYLVNYTVDVDASVLSASYGVNGLIFIFNSTQAAITVSSVVDALAPVSCTLDGAPVTPPVSLPAVKTMLCTYAGSLNTPAPSNTATVTSSIGTAVATSPIDWTKAAGTEIDECAEINDTYGGLLGNVCANGQTSWSFPYSRWIGPYDVCGDYTVENVADFLTNDTGATGSDNWIVNVNVPCAGGCTLTPGYWKTHSSYGPAPYDDTWAQIGENTTFFLSGKSYYQALWTSPQGNAYWILAHAYIAAKLNFLNDADSTPAVDTAFAAATVLFQTYTPDQIGALSGSSPLRALFISLATTLDNYNNGLIGPGHCDE